MKFFLVVFLLASICALVFAQEEILTASSWSTPMNPVNENGTSEGRPGNRIIGGKEANIGLIPYQAGLLIQKSDSYYLCGGSLIAPNWVVTAAHCVRGAISFRVRLGTLNYNTGGQYFYTTQSIAHPTYNPSNLNDDIALIRLPGNAAINGNVQPIRIAASSLSFSSVRVSGWGKMSNGQVSTTLRYADLWNLEVNQCSRYYFPGIITANTVCTVSSIGESTCSGDSGGPLVDNASRQLVGVVSFVSGRGCMTGAPAGYVRVANYRTWIREVTGISSL